MQAAVIDEHGTVEQVKVADVPAPELTPGTVRVELRAAALNHLDLFVVRGIPGLELPKPHVLGADGAGVVTHVAENVEGVAPGDEVVLDPGLGSPDDEGYALLGEMVAGTIAEQIVVPFENCFPKPKDLSWVEAAAFPLVTLTAWRMLVSKAKLQAGEWVLIHGIGGGVSLTALQIATHLRAHAVVTSHSEDKRRRAMELGAARVVDYVNEDVVAAAREATGGRGVDVVVDNVGEATFADSIRAVRKGGRIVTCGATTGPKIPVDVRRVFWNQISILGSTMGDRDEFAAMLAVVAAGGLQPVIDEVFPLSEARAALERLERAEQFGKIVIEIGR
ncbi:MAG: zinc-binding dehydrogenase [Acidobacteriota bacterium]|jgi:NADPH:quinone reductase-like Zn-dependent oxidoreductase